MAGREQPQLTATVVQTLIGDLVQEAVADNHHVKITSDSDTCQRLFDILGFQPCADSDDTEDFASIPDDYSDEKNTNTKGDIVDVVISCSQCTLYNSPKESREYHHSWHSWLIDAVADETSEDEVVLYASRKNQFFPHLSTVAVQTEQPRLRKCDTLFVKPGDRTVPSTPVPCELTRQTIFIDAMTMPVPNALARAPLADRFCYMLTDFASALYCSLAIMCCCTPNMFR